MKISRFAIVIVNLDPTVGSEIKKTRPCVVVSPDELNRNLRSVVVIPLTSQSKDYPTRVAVTTQKGTGYAVVEQIRTIDKGRITKVAGTITKAERKKLTETIRQTYVD